MSVAGPSNPLGDWDTYLLIEADLSNLYLESLGQKSFFASWGAAALGHTDSVVSQYASYNKSKAYAVSQYPEIRSYSNILGLTLLGIDWRMRMINQLRENLLKLGGAKYRIFDTRIAFATNIHFNYGLIRKKIECSGVEVLTKIRTEDDAALYLSEVPKVRYAKPRNRQKVFAA